MKRITKIAVIFLSVIVFHGCGGGDSVDSTTPTNTTGDSNDTSPPVFTSPENVTILENQRSVITVTTSDASDVVYSLVSSAQSGFFDINSSSGVLELKNDADYEQIREYIVDINASDSAFNWSVQTLYVHVQNVPEVIPTLSDLNVSVDENISVGSVVGQVGVRDAGDTAISSFRLDDSSVFSIDNQGVITTKVLLDYETKNSYSLRVYATNGAGESQAASVMIYLNDIAEGSNAISIPTLVVIMNWDNYSENDPSVWYDKIFNTNTNSVNRWYSEALDQQVELTPLGENFGTVGDGIVSVSMGKNHPGGSDDYAFRDTEIRNAITSSDVVNSFDFTTLDLNGDGDLNVTELQIIFIVAGGEEAYGDPQDHSIWAHSWSFDSNNAPTVDGVNVMRYTGDSLTTGDYARFGANHGDHTATIGVIVHELGHALFNLDDYYDNGGGSGLGWYDVMSGGGWAQKAGDNYSGETPTQLSIFNRIDSHLNTTVEDVNGSVELTLSCSKFNGIKLLTQKTNEYFLLACRDTAQANSDISIDFADGSFTQDRLFVMVYHVDTDKVDNTEDGVQTQTNHYKVAVVEKDTTTLMTDTESIFADFNDVYIDGDTLSPTQLRLYDGTDTNYTVEVLSSDTTQRTMHIKITR